MPAPVLQTYTAYWTESSTTTHTIAAPAGVVAGDLLFLHFQINTNYSGGLTLPDGFTLLYRAPANGNLVETLSYKIAGASEPSTYSILTASSVSSMCTLLRITGIDTTTPIDAFVNSPSPYTSSTTPTSPAVTTASQDVLVLHTYAGSNGHALVMTEGTGYPSGDTGLYHRHFDSTNTAAWRSMGLAWRTASATTVPAAVWTTGATSNQIWRGHTTVIRSPATAYPVAIDLAAAGVVKGNTSFWGTARGFSPYPGPAMRIERVSDGAQTDIGFAADGTLDTAAVTAFLDGSAGRVVSMGDQGQTYTLINAAAANRPAFDASVPGPRFDGSDDYFTLTSPNPGQWHDAISNFVIFGRVHLTGGDIIFDFGGASNGAAIRYQGGALKFLVAASDAVTQLSMPIALSADISFVASLSGGTMSLRTNSGSISSAGPASIPAHGSGVGWFAAVNADDALATLDSDVTGRTPLTNGAGALRYGGVYFGVLTEQQQIDLLDQLVGETRTTLTADLAWRVLASAERDAAWRDMAAAERATAWKIATAAERASAWSILAAEDAPAAWRIAAARDDSMAWRVLAGTSIEVAWHDLGATDQPIGWRLLADAEIDLAWRLLSTFEAEAALAWRILTAAEQATAWRRMAEAETGLDWRIFAGAETDLAWHIFAEAEAGLGWRVLAEVEADLAWRVLAAGEVEQALAWRIMTAAGRATAWRLLAAREGATAWRNLAEAEAPLAWRILQADEQAASWRVLAAAEEQTAWRLLARGEITSAWAILTETSAEAALAWRILAGSDIETTWRVLAAREAVSAWQIGVLPAPVVVYSDKGLQRVLTGPGVTRIFRASTVIRPSRGR